MEATASIDGFSVRVAASVAAVHLTGEFAGNLDLTVRFAPAVSEAAVVDGLKARVAEDGALLDVLGFRVADGAFELTFFSEQVASAGNAPSSVELLWSENGTSSLGSARCLPVAEPDSPRVSDAPVKLEVDGPGLRVLAWAALMLILLTVAVLVISGLRD